MRKEIGIITGGGVLGGLTKIATEVVDEGYAIPPNIAVAIPVNCLLGTSCAFIVIFLGGKFIKIAPDNLGKTFATAIAAGLLSSHVLGYLQRRGELEAKLVQLEHQNQVTSQEVIEVEQQKVSQIDDIQRSVKNPQLQQVLEQQQQYNIESIVERAIKSEDESAQKDAIATIKTTVAKSQSPDTYLKAIASLLRFGVSEATTKNALSQIHLLLQDYQKNKNSKISNEATQAIAQLSDLLSVGK